MRRCILSFNQLMFHNLQRLYDAFNYYKQGQGYSFKQAKMFQQKLLAEQKNLIFLGAPMDSTKSSM